MSKAKLSIAYVRRNAGDELRELVFLAEDCYAHGILDFLILDLSQDKAALQTLASLGDPLRYLTVPTSSSPDFLLQTAAHAMTGEVVHFVDDDLPADCQYLPSAQRINFVGRTMFVSDPLACCVAMEPACAAPPG